MRRIISGLKSHTTWVALAAAIFAGLQATWAARTERAAKPAPTTRSAGGPEYPIPYRRPDVEEIARKLRAVKGRLEEIVLTSIATPPTTEFSEPPASATRRWPLNIYPMGVVYSGMLNAAEATADSSFTDFDAKQFNVFADAIAKVDLAHASHHRGNITALLFPKALDDCGAIGAAMIKARRAGIGPDLKLPIDRIADYIHHRQLRLDDGTLARDRPFADSVWADDAYMSIPFLAQMGALTNNREYFDDAAAQMLHFEHYLFVPSVGLFSHHWNAGNPDNQPRYFWGRANGWCFMAMTELLEVLPADQAQRGNILQLFRQQAQALASLQGGDGLWHQMLDRPDSYTETSCSAMFVFGLARGVNRGWLDAMAYGPVAQAGWNALSTRIDDAGHVTGTCIGTGYGDDYVFYYHRPATDDYHGYGPVLLAGAEMIKLLQNPKWRSVGANGNAPAMFEDRSRPATEP